MVPETPFSALFAWVSEAPRENTLAGLFSMSIQCHRSTDKRAYELTKSKIGHRLDVFCK